MALAGPFFCTTGTIYSICKTRRYFGGNWLGVGHVMDLGSFCGWLLSTGL